MGVRVMKGKNEGQSGETKVEGAGRWEGYEREREREREQA